MGEPEITLHLDKVTESLKDLTNREHDLSWMARTCLRVFLLQRERAVRGLSFTRDEIKMMGEIVREDAPDPEHLGSLAHSADWVLPYRDEFPLHARLELRNRLKTLSAFEAAALTVTLQGALEVEDRYRSGLDEALERLGLVPAAQIPTPS